MKHKQIIVGLAALLLLITGIFFKLSYAQKTNSGITIYPSNFDLKENPGESTTQQVYIQNNLETPLTIQVKTENFTAQGEEGGVALTQETTNYSLASWITVTPTTATIQPHTSQLYTYTVHVPTAAEPGGHFGSLVFHTVASTNVKGTGAILQQQVAALVLLEVPGNVTEDAQAISLAADKKFYEFGPVQFDLRVKNNGNVHVAPFGEIAVTGWFGQRFDIQLQPYNVLPQAIREIPTTLKNKFLFGPYTATLIASYGDKNQPLYGSTTFYAFPVRYGIIALVVLIFLFVLRKRLGKAIKALLTGK